MSLFLSVDVAQQVSSPCQVAVLVAKFSADSSIGCEAKRLFHALGEVMSPSTVLPLRAEFLGRHLRGAVKS